MTRNKLGLASLLVVALMSAAGVAVGSSLPADARLPIHWGIDGTPDSFADKWVALMCIPAMSTAMTLLFYFLPVLEPRRNALARSQDLYLWGWAATLLVLVLADVALISTGLGWQLPIQRLMPGGVGVLLMVVGNFLGKSRRMYLMGLRTPWTLASEEVWIKTNRLAGKLMSGGGALILIAALLPIGPWLIAGLVIGALAVIVVVPIVYSFVAWRAEQAQSSR